MLLKWGCTPAHWLIAYCSKEECDVWWKWRWGAAQVILALFQGGSDESLRHKPLTNPTVLPSCCVNVSPIMTSQKICAVFPTGAFTNTHIRSQPSVLRLFWSANRMYERSYSRLRHVVLETCVNLYPARLPKYAGLENKTPVNISAFKRRHTEQWFLTIIVFSRI